MADTLQLILDKLDAIEQRQQDIQLEQKSLYRQVEALFALYQKIDFRAPFLNMRSWVASPDFLAILSTLIQEHRPNTIFEAGGGATTIISAYSLQQLGHGHVYAVDHQQKFADQTHDQIKQHGLTEYATAIYAPLQSIDIDETSWQWYDMSQFDFVSDIDLLVVDGPPQYDNPSDMARYPALPLMKDKLKDDCLILMDDADRENEQAISKQWEQEFSLELIRYYEKAWADTDKGAKLYRYLPNNQSIS
jgi:predicted O-methyltransferase YrrM